MRLSVGLAVSMLLLAGCARPAPASPEPAVPFDGQAAHGFVAGLITNDDGMPRVRVPGTAAHVEAAAWLWEAMQVEGWTAQWQNFTGADYAGLDKGATRFYYDSPGYCTPDERERLAGLAFHNLWAVHESAADTDRLVLLGAHWESKRFASQDANASLRGQGVPGANDGASGVGLLLEFMRHVADHDVELPFDVGVAFFDGEDGFEDCHPLAGSTYFVDQLRPGDVERFLLLDMVGDPQARFIREGASQACDPGLVDLLHALAPSVGLAANFPNVTRSVSDDHVPFLEAGIPAVDLIDFGRGFPPYWHTTHDTLDKVDAGMLGRVGDLVLAVVRDPGFVHTWPAAC